jgi:hypothetical protein
MSVRFQAAPIGNMQYIPSLLSEQTYSEDKSDQTFIEAIAKELRME